MSRYWSPIVSRLTPYVPGEQPHGAKLIKLNTNEHPFGPSRRVLEAIRGETGASLRLYPDPGAAALRQALGARFGVGAEQVFVGNGSDEVLAHAFMALLRHDAPVWFPDITYSFYPVYCGLYSIAFETRALDAGFAIKPEDFMPAGGARAGGIIFANPNAPTGICLPLADVERIVAANSHCVVVVDEAYVDFGGESAVALVARYPNLLVVHSFSKSRSLAGLRVGYAIGQPDLIEALHRVKDSFNSYPLDRLALAGALASVEDETFFRDSCQAVIALRESLAAGLTELDCEVLPSAANFVFARHPAHRGANLAQALREQGILVRHFARPRINDFVRITVGTEAQCNALLAALHTLLR